jgi:small redox-active disulfide protein 2
MPVKINGGAMLTIKVLGPGCPNCNKVEEILKTSVATMGMDAQVEKITDYNEIVEYGVLSTLGLMIDGNVVCSGRIPSQAEVTTWLADAAVEVE